MGYILKPSKFFLNQLEDLSDEAAKLIEKKLRLLKVNPLGSKEYMAISYSCSG